MKFFQDIRNSIYNPAYYTELREKPASYSIGYFFLFSLLLTVIVSLFITIFTAPLIHKFLINAAPVVLDAYPDGLEITIKNGNVSTNVQEPYYIKLPDVLKNDDFKKDGFSKEHLLIIDTASNAAIEDFKKLNTVALLTKTSIIVQEENGKISAQSLEGIREFTLNEATLSSLVKNIEPYLKLIYPIMLIGLLIGVYFVTVSNLIYLLFGALLIWAVSSLKKAGIGYGQSYKLGMHLMTLPLIVTWIPFLGFPFAFTFILMIMAALNINPKASVADNADSKTEPAKNPENRKQLDASP